MPASNNVLLGMRVKRTVKVDIKGPIMTYIKRVYGDHMASEAEESLDALQEMRNQIVASGGQPRPPWRPAAAFLRARARPRRPRLCGRALAEPLAQKDAAHGAGGKYVHVLALAEKADA